MEGAVSNKDLESQSLVWNHLFGMVDSLVLKCAINLDIIDIIHRHGGPITINELAPLLPVPCTKPSILYRIMRYLAHMKLITLVPGFEESYTLTPASKFLIKGGNNSLVPYANLLLNHDTSAALFALDLCLDGSVSFDQARGESLWEFSSRDSKHNEKFNEAMASGARIAIPGVLKVCREAFEGMKTVVDVGGGTGTTAMAVVNEFPHITYTVFDLPHVVSASKKSPGIAYVGGNMFKSSLPRADGVILMWILHDWTDDECLEILKRCKEAIPEEKGKVIIVDAVVGEDLEPELYHTRLALDISMMAYTGGKERTEKEWRQLLLKAGFTKFNMTPINAVQLAIEASR